MTGDHLDGVPTGTVFSSEALPERLWFPGTASAHRLTYLTTDARDARALSSGAIWIPTGAVPAGGWPVISWAHGTSGLATRCAPSLRGPTEPERDGAYLSAWMRQGYAVVGTDYVGLGSPGRPAYLHGRSQAANIVDMVRAARFFTAETGQQLSRQWAAVGQSEGGGAAVQTARYATALSGSDLDFRAAVATGTPAVINTLVLLMGPHVVFSPSPHTSSFVVMILNGLRVARPDLDVDRVLSPTGRRFLDEAPGLCAQELSDAMSGVTPGKLFSAPVASVPGIRRALADHLGMPTSGFDRPFFMAHGLFDADVPFLSTALYVLQLKLRRQPVTFRTYRADHNGTMASSLAHSVPFLRRQFRTGAPTA